MALINYFITDFEYNPKNFRVPWVNITECLADIKLPMDSEIKEWCFLKISNASVISSILENKLQKSIFPYLLKIKIYEMQMIMCELIH